MPGNRCRGEQGPPNKNKNKKTKTKKNLKGYVLMDPTKGEKDSMGQELPWVPETFPARFLVLVKRIMIPLRMRKNLWYPG